MSTVTIKGWNRLRGSFCFLLFLAIVVLSNGQPNYCTLCRDHTMCVYTNPNPKPSCNARSSGLTTQQRTQVLNLHNTYRQRVASGNELRGSPGPQPRARSMPNLVWDNELATIAQRWANQCTFGHDRCRKVQQYNVGQNVAMQWTTGSTPAGVDTLVTGWYNEVALFDSRQVRRVTNFDRVGHYTQMLWATTTKVGCGYLNYMNGNRNTVLLVCNYGPAGNVVGGRVYEPV